MSPKNPKDAAYRRGRGEPAKSPVTLRLGDLEPEVEERAAGAPLGSIVRRDLARYYRLMRTYEVALSRVEDADVVAHALRGFDDGAYRFVWAAVEEVLSARDMLEGRVLSPSRFARGERERLVTDLRLSLGDHGRRMALLDTVERYWQRLEARGIKTTSGEFSWPDGYDPEYPVTEAELDAMVEVGLISEGTARQYRKRRDAPDRPPLPPPPTEAELYLRDVQQSIQRRVRKFPGRYQRAQAELEEAMKPKPKRAGRRPRGERSG